NRALLHVRDHLLGHKLWSSCARDQHASDDEISLLRRFGDGVRIRSQSVNASAKDVIEFAQTIQIEVNDGDVRTHAECDLCGMSANDSAADNDNSSRRNSGHAAQ